MMKIVSGVKIIMLIASFTFPKMSDVALAGTVSGKDVMLDSVIVKEATLVKQALDYTENPVDIPNPDRRFYRPEAYVIPVESRTPGVPDLATTISSTKVAVKADIVYMEFDLKKFSSNAPLNGKPIGAWSTAGSKKPDYGTTRPLTGAFGKVPFGDYDIYMKINDPKETSTNKRCIEFANKGNSWDTELGANLIGSTTVL